MKIRSLAGMLGGSACVVLFASFAIAQGGELVHAEYGFEGRRVDVTAQVRAFVREGMLQMEVSNQTLGVDPAPQRTKELVIQIHHWDGDTQAYVFREGTVVNLELDPPRGYERQERGLHIIRAYYGGEGRFVNVTEQLRSLVVDGRIYVRADNEHLGGDPDPRIRKQLRVLYWFDGERRNVTIPEKAELRLP